VSVRTRPAIATLTVLPYDPAIGLAAGWREGLARVTSDAVLLLAGTGAIDAGAEQAMRAAATTADAVVVRTAGVPVALLIRRADAPRLALLRNRARGRSALTDAITRARQARCRVAAIDTDLALTLAPAIGDESLGFTARRLIERFGWFGFVSGAFSRTHRNAEVWQYRRSTPVEDPSARCPLCGAGTDRQAMTTLRTAEDLRALGDHAAMLCLECAVARTVPPPREQERVITPDVGAAAMSGWQRALLARFIDERVERVRAAISDAGNGAERAPRCVDIGGGACAFANALAASGAQVTVFEPNPANAAAAGAGVRFVAAPFDEASVAQSAIPDGSLDAITMWHSLEHVPDPIATLTLCRRLLRPGGVLYVSVPNLDSLQADLTGNRWTYQDIPHHVSQFTPEGLAAAVRRAGFVRPTPHWWSEEYEIFGFYQSLLNVFGDSHNYFYNRAKKGKQADAGANPARTRLVTALGPALLPVVVLLSWWATVVSKPSCVELHAEVPQ
jgi:SAM-dependent methyltransferase